MKALTVSCCLIQQVNANRLTTIAAKSKKQHFDIVYIILGMLKAVCGMDLGQKLNKLFSVRWYKWLIFTT